MANPNPVPRRPIIETEPDIIDRIANHISQGAWDYVAAEAEGIADYTFYKYMRLGRQDEEADNNSVYRTFYQKISKARQIARMGAEKSVWTANSLAYLKYGPGRERPNRPGWTESTQITGADSGPIQIEDGRSKLLDLLLKKLTAKESSNDDT